MNPFILYSFVSLYCILSLVSYTDRHWGKTLKVQRTKAKAKLMFKILNMSGPKSLTDLFTYKNENTHYCLRDNETTLVLPQPRTNSMKKSFMFNGAKIWNSVPKEIRGIRSQSLFERKIAAHVTK